MNKSFKLKLTAMANGGSALGRHDGRVVFVPYTIPGETIRAVITEDKKKFINAAVQEIIAPSPHRTQPLCPHFGPGQCGGCHLQHITYEHQLTLKQEIVIDQFERIGKFTAPPVQSAIPSPSPWEYRSHAAFTPLPTGQLGFVSDDNSRVVPITRCRIIHPALQDLHEQLDLDTEDIERVKFQTGTQPDDTMIIIQSVDDLAPEITVDFPVSINLLLSDNEPVNLIGSPQVTYQVFDRQFRVTAGAFSQVNEPMMEILVDLVLERLNLQGTETVLDLYSGVGLFTGFIAPYAEHVISIESYPPAVTDAEYNLDDLDNIDLVEGPTEAVLSDLAGPFDAVVVDPPRAGLTNTVIDAIIRLSPAVLVYVSCDPATLARDARKFTAQGYQLIDVQPVDMFPQTYHIESVATFHK